MSDIVRKEGKILDVKYVHDTRCFAIHIESDDREFIGQINIKDLLPMFSNLDDFSKEDMINATAEFCQMMKGKPISAFSSTEQEWREL